MARLFSAVGDRLTTGAITLPSVFSLCWWWKNQSDFGLAVDTGGSDLLRSYFTTATNLTFIRFFSTSGGVASNVAPGLTRANWNHFAWTHDGTTAVPTFYGNGVATTGGAWSPAAVGTLNTGSETFIIGNSAANPAGSIGHMSINNVVLTAGEVRQAMLYGYAPRGLVGYWPVYGIDSPEPDYSGLKRNATVTTAVAATGPPIASTLLYGMGGGRVAYSASAAPAAGGNQYNRLLLGVG